MAFPQNNAEGSVLHSDPTNDVIFIGSRPSVIAELHPQTSEDASGDVIFIGSRPSVIATLHPQASEGASEVDIVIGSRPSVIVTHQPSSNPTLSTEPQLLDRTSPHTTEALPARRLNWRGEEVEVRPNRLSRKRRQKEGEGLPCKVARTSDANPASVNETTSDSASSLDEPSATSDLDPPAKTSPRNTLKACRKTKHSIASSDVDNSTADSPLQTGQGSLPNPDISAEGSQTTHESQRSTEMQYATRPVPKFNAEVIEHHINLTPATEANISISQLREELFGPVDHAVSRAQPDGTVDVALSGAGLMADIHAVLHIGQGDNVETFLQEVEKVLQSNSSLVDEGGLLTYTISIAHNRRGGAIGGRRRFDTISDHELLLVKSHCLYNPPDVPEPICFAMCLARAVVDGVDEANILDHAKRIQTEAGFTLDHEVSFSDVAAFERLLNKKIVVLYRAAGTKDPQYFETHLSLC